ncbi:Polyketide hydroxylase WhiE VIII [Actinokineospora spheciospongiae]|uniref:Polyketide hydroxylase WhiE VIII n=1 Tax=Actinokineospora spheciospongiae TaxID=909613 RepID=W7IQZ4_9PSEU|nr:FAD-dependent oxidoreductase [Actinokineospora spheciospongiae]EWC63335.1 Polyketide hydroxylase WhiE VIII [Actinokineospora spheciospongiae]
MSAESERVPVLVVGAGGVGLAAALFLTRQGVRPLVVERHGSTSVYPRATGLAPRTRELFREAGVDREVLAAGSLMARSGGKVVVRRLAGEDLGAARRNSPVADDSTDVVGAFSPINSSNGICPQDVLEPILLDRARAGGAQVRFDTEVTGLRQEADHVLVDLLDRGTGRESTVAAEYVVAADGADSGTRRRLGIGTSGPGALGGPMISVLFRADLAELVRGNEFVVCEIRNEETEGLLLAINNTDRWVFYISCHPERGETPADFPVERCVSLVRAAIGLPDLEITPLAVMPWQPAAFTADRFADGRVFLAGDAAHVMPPSGAYGLNTGIADAHNLAWKLGLVLSGRAGAGLLDSYAAEREPVAGFTVAQAMLVQRNPRLHWDLESSLAERERIGMGHPVVVSLGYQYTSGAVIGPRSELPSLADPGLDLDGHPGSRAPHLWVTENEVRKSTLDLLGDGFVLLCGPDGQRWREHAAGLVGQAGYPLRVRVIGPEGDVIDPDRVWPTVAGIKPDGALLVRPDGFVAWRAADAGALPELEAALRAVLALAG